MKLQEILITSEYMEDYDVVYAKRPWSLDSDACIVRYQPDEIVPPLLNENFFEYFLEAPLIKDIRKQVESTSEDSSEFLHVLLYYGENDAFP